MIAPGTKISARYTVIDYVDSGGMQDVYKASDELTGEIVALKTPQAGQVNKRFKQSAQLSGRINNYNVAKTFDYFETGATCYLIEEFIDGTTLEAATLDKYPQADPHLVAHILLRISKGLAASHLAGVAHRDLKPSNILVSRDLGTVKITDFGIATLAEELFDEVIAKNGDLTRSTSGTIKGALPFMAPEMIFRKSGDKVGMQADVWSLGALLFRLMTGEFPFGEGMMVPVNVEKKKPLRWPAFIRVNPQYAPLAESLISIAELCLNHDKDARPTASQLVAMCEDICFQFGSRQSGEIVSINGSKGLIKSDSGKSIFYHFDSVYGKLPPRLNAPVTFSIHPGTPHPRAHPVIVCS